jgi:SAM-dependent methyltransferase
MTKPNDTQARYWNEQAGQSWVAMQRDLDAELEPFGVALLGKLGLGAGERVLDVGCGAGATSLMLAERAHPGQVVGIDISAPLLARARERAAAVDNLSFEQADAQTFAFPPASFDSIFSRFGVMFFADPIAAFTNLRSALKTGGRLGFVCWRAWTENPSFSLPLEAALPFLPEPPEPPQADAPGAFAFAHRDRTARILEGAGYRDVDITALDSELVFAGRRDLEGAVDLALAIGPLSRAAATLSPAVQERVRAAVQDAFLPHHGPAGVLLPAATWLVTARRPA